MGEEKEERRRQVKDEEKMDKIRERGGETSKGDEPQG